MWRQKIGAACLVTALVSPAAADVTIVEDDFGSYTDDLDLYLAWEPASGGGTFPPPTDDAGILTTDASTFPGIQGQAVAHIGGAINQYDPPTFLDPVNMDDVLQPTDQQSIVFGGDLFVPSSNTRLSIGLRSNEPTGGELGQNILEMGAWNTELSVLAYRLTNFDSGSVDWQFFDLPQELDTSGDGNVTLGDIGPAWHRYQATVTPMEVTFELDVFRDGTVDATAVVPATPTAEFFNSFRFGGPSGFGSIGEGAFDNVFLRLVDVMPGGGVEIPGDYNNNGQVEQGDLDLVLLHWGRSVSVLPDTWTNMRPTEGIIDQVELDGVLLNWGDIAPQLAAAAAVPEPSTLAMLAAGTAVLLWGARHARGHFRS